MREPPNTGIADSDAAWAALAARAHRPVRGHRADVATERDAVVPQTDGLYADAMEHVRQSRLKRWQAVER